MTQNFIDNCRSIADSTLALCEQAENLQLLQEQFKNGEVATLFLKIKDETISFRDFKCDENGETIRQLLNTKAVALLRAFRENADSLTTFVEEEESR